MSLDGKTFAVSVYDVREYGYWKHMCPSIKITELLSMSLKLTTESDDLIPEQCNVELIRARMSSAIGGALMGGLKPRDHHHRDGG